MENLHYNNIPTATEVNYSSMGDICGYQQLLCKMFEQAGGFEYPYKNNSAIRRVQAQGLIWLEQVKSIIDRILCSGSCDGLTMESVPQMLSSYDLFYRICYGKPDFSYVRDVRLRIVDLRVKGDKRISLTDTVLGILFEAERDSRGIHDKYLQYAYSIKSEWVTELITDGRFNNLSFSEAYSRLAYLLKGDLRAYLGSKEQKTIKMQWIKDHLLSDSQIDSLNSNDLFCYIGFFRRVSHLLNITPGEQDKTYHRLISKLATHPDLTPLSRLAIVTTLAPSVAA